MNLHLNHSFRTLGTKSEVDEVIQLLAENGIQAISKKDSGDLDFVIQDEAPSNKHEILINVADFEKAEAILFEKAKQYLNEIPKDYYLYSFSDTELLDVLIQKDEWNEIDVLLSRKILEERNVSIDINQIEAQQKVRQAELSKPQGGQLGWIILGYLMAFLGGFLGLLIGYFIWHAMNKLPNGTKVYSYDEVTRKHGKIIFILSAIIFPIALILRIFTEISVWG